MRARLLSVGIAAALGLVIVGLATAQDSLDTGWQVEVSEYAHREGEVVVRDCREFELSRS